MKKKKQLFIFFVIFAIISFTSGFTNNASVYADTPTTITGYTASTDHGGTVIGGLDDQWINLTVNFSDKISITNSENVINELKIMLNNNSNYIFGNTPNTYASTTYPGYATVELGSDQKSLVFKIHFGFAAYAGSLSIQALSGITSITNANTGTPVIWSDLSLLVSNGVGLQTISQTAGNPDENVNASVTKKVITPSSCTRGMVHMILLKNGVPVGTLNSYGANITTHYHLYLSLYADQFASMIPGWLTSYASEYNVVYNGTSVTNADSSVTYNGDTVTITALSSNKGDILDLRIYTYPQTIQSDLDKQALTSMITTAETLDISKYTADSLAILNNEINIAKSMNNSNYYLQSEIDAETQKLTNTMNSLELKHIELKDTSTGISIIGLGNSLLENTILSVSQISNSNTLDYIRNSIKVVDTGSSIDKFNLYNISLMSDNIEIQPNGDVQVSLPVPAGYDINKLAIYHIDDNGNVSKINFTVENGYILFTTNSFSYYAIAQSSQLTSVGTANNTASPVNTGNNMLYSLYAFLCILSLAGLVLILRKSNKIFN